MALSVSVWARTLEVGPGAPFASISAALAKARKGDVIEVGSGNYAEAVTVQKAVTIRGVDSGSGLPIIEPKGGPFVFHLTGGGAVLEQLVIEGAEKPQRALAIKDMVRKDAGILIESRGNSLSAITVRNLHNGVLIFGDDNDVRDSEFDSNAVVGAAVRSGGGNSFTNSAFTANGLYGLMLGWLNDPALATGDTREWYKVLRDLKNVENNRVEGNSFTGNGFAGLMLAGAAFQNEVRRNTAIGNGGAIPPEINPWSRGAGIYLSCGPMRNVIADNDVRGNDNSGITLDPGMDNIFRNNTICDNTSFGIGVAASTGNRFEANAVSGHMDYGIIFKRWVNSQMPTASNLLTANDLSRNGVNAYDESGIAFEPPPNMRFVNEAARRKALAKYSVPNRWDDGSRGNHYDDFDETSEGFADANGDGIGEAPHPIPGGAAVDHLPMAQGSIDQGEAPAAAGRKLAAVEALCMPFTSCEDAAQSCDQ
jgi:parallel beta-helix repeat protein